MITFIVGEAGSGKTALATYLLKQKYIREGQAIHKKSCALIAEQSAKFGRNFTPPDRVPIYTNYHVRLHVGFNRYFEPYYFNPYYYGVTNDTMDTEYAALGGVLVFDESQRIFNSRKSATFADFVSYAFEIHRQGHYDIILIAQRGKLLDCNIRDLGVHVIEVVDMENETGAAGYIRSSKWHCRESDNWSDAEEYFTDGEKTYTETEYENKGNIFESFDSFERVSEFLPPKGLDFDYLPHKKPENLTAREEAFYKSGEPKGYRGGYKENNEKGGNRKAA